jgi:hypothetical protein
MLKSRCRAEVSPECRRSSETSFKKPRCRPDIRIANRVDHCRHSADLHFRQNLERAVISKMRVVQGWLSDVCSQDVHG